MVAAVDIKIICREKAALLTVMFIRHQLVIRISLLQNRNSALLAAGKNRVSGGEYSHPLYMKVSY